MMRVQIWHIVHTCWLISVYLLEDFSRLWQRLPVLGLDLLGFADYASSKPPRAHQHQELGVRRSGMPSPPPSIQNSASRFPSLSLSFAFVDRTYVFFTYELWPIPSKRHTQI